MRIFKVIMLTLLAFAMVLPSASLSLDANEVINKTESKDNTRRLG